MLIKLTLAKLKLLFPCAGSNWMRHLALNILLMLTVHGVHAGEVRYLSTVNVVLRDGCARVVIEQKNIGSDIMYFPPELRLVGLRDAAGRNMRHLGPIANFPMPEHKDYLPLAPGETLLEEVALAPYGLEKAGDYTVLVNVDYADMVTERMYYHGNKMRTFHFSGKCSPGAIGQPDVMTIRKPLK